MVEYFVVSIFLSILDQCETPKKQKNTNELH